MINKIIYRYELPDGGGPFCTRNGQNRIYPEIIFKDNTLYGCSTLEKLNDWFKKRNISYNNCVLTIYSGKVIKENENEILIEKNTAKKIK